MLFVIVGFVIILLTAAQEKILGNFLNGVVGGWSPVGSTRHCGHQ
jgi:hypothetical protein